jgi:hypothetical protein
MWTFEIEADCLQQFILSLLWCKVSAKNVLVSRPWFWLWVVVVFATDLLLTNIYLVVAIDLSLSI